MVTKEIKQFVITQMKEADWEIEKYLNKYTSKHLINFESNIRQKVDFVLKIPTGYNNSDLKISRKELGINYFQFRWLLSSVKKSCKLVDKRRRDAEISRNWKKFLDKNRDLKRDHKINQIID
jgi:hypothetical protein